jgi:hypothetical protein
MSVSRRDFLRLRTTTSNERVLELSCRMLFMRCSDAAIGSPSAEEYEQATGEPPAVLDRRSPADMFAAIEQDLVAVRVLRLVEPEWLDSIDGVARLRAILEAFRVRGGRVEHGR